MDDKYLLEHLPKIDDIMIKRDEKEYVEKHEFSEEFQQNMNKLIMENKREKYPKIHRRMLSKVAIIVFCVSAGVFGSGVIVNAATDGALFSYIYEICFESDNGATWNFKRSNGEKIDTSDLPEGTIQAVITYEGNDVFRLKDGSVVNKNRLIFVNIQEELQIGQEIEVFILPEE